MASPFGFECSCIEGSNVGFDLCVEKGCVKAVPRRTDLALVAISFRADESDFPLTEKEFVGLRV